MEFLRRVFEQLKTGWANLSGNQKIIYSAIAVSLIVAIIVTGVMLGSRNYIPLYNDLTVVQSADISQRLQEMNVPYQLSTDGTTIMVPDNMVHQLRLDLATQIPFGGVVGFESFDQTRFGETETDKRVRFLAALQGELTRTVMQINEVESAMVHLAIPEPSIFLSDDAPAKASVFLNLRPLGRMEQDKVRSIMYLVANAVEGLSPENVTVVDANGTLLSDGIAGADSPFAASAMSATQLEIKTNYEKELARSLQSMLERVKGPGKAAVSVSASFDFDTVEVNQETYGDSVLRSEQGSESRSEGTTPGGDPAGVDPNLPGAPAFQENAGGESSSQSSEFIRNYEIDRVVESRVRAPGTITNLSVSVIIDGELNEEERIALEDVVSSASGLDFQRGDVVNVVGMAFNTEAYDAMQENIARELRNQQLMTLINYGLIALAILGLAGLGYFIRKRSLEKPVSTLAGKKVGDLATANYSSADLEELDPVIAEKADLERKVERLAKTQPEDVARVIKSWLTEDMR